MYTQEKPDLEELAHHGVLGMKWGKTRAKADSSSIHAARGRNITRRNKINKQESKINTLKGQGKATKSEENNLAKMKNDYLKNPDRVIAARMTRGEKSVAVVLGLSGIGTPIAVAGIAGTSARSRRIERKQETGSYNKKS